MITISRRPLPFPAPSVSAVADYCARLKIVYVLVQSFTIRKH